MILERDDRLGRHRVHRRRPDQLLDVHDVAVIGILRRGRRPEAALRRRSLAGEELPARPGERLLPVAVREPRVRDRELALEPRRLAADLLQPPVGLGVDARDEEARDRRDARGIAAARDQPLQPADVRLDDGRVALEREDQGHVDRLALRDAVLDRGEARHGRGDLHEQVRLVDLAVQPDRLLEGRLAVVGQRRVDLERDVAVDAFRPVPDRLQQVAGAPDVLHRELEEDLGRVVLGLQQLAELLVVPVPGRERLLEDRRVRGDADDGVLLQQPGELAGLEHLARDRVDPRADAGLVQLMQS